MVVLVEEICHGRTDDGFLSNLPDGRPSSPRGRDIIPEPDFSPELPLESSTVKSLEATRGIQPRGVISRTVSCPTPTTTGLSRSCTSILLHCGMRCDDNPVSVPLRASLPSVKNELGRVPFSVFVNEFLAEMLNDRVCDDRCLCRWPLNSG